MAKSSEICVGRLVALSSGALLESQEHKAPKPITHSDNQNNFLILITIKNELLDVNIVAKVRFLGTCYSHY